MKSVRRLKQIFLNLLFIAILFPLVVPVASAKRQVVVYTALDQIFSEPILQSFEKETGIRVKAVYDIEATKTTGLVNRLIAEKNNPRCDVFWNNEVIKSILLKQRGVLQPYRSPSARDIPDTFKDKDGYWTGFAARARVLVANTRALGTDEAPKSILDLAKPVYKGKAAIANPLFGTTGTHVAALFAYWGQDKAQAFFKSLKTNDIRILDGNATVKDRVGAGALLVGFTDTDDANVGIQAGLPITKIFPDKEDMGTLLIPNTVSMIAGCPHRREAEQLIDFLLSKEVEKKLAFCPSVQMPLRKDVPTPEDFVTIGQIKAMPVDFEKVAAVMEPAITFVQREFLR